MSTQYLVTGAAGNLGFNLISELLKRGKKVRALVLANDRLAKRLPKDVEIVEGDILNKPDLDSFFTRPESYQSTRVTTKRFTTSMFPARRI